MVTGEQQWDEHDIVLRVRANDRDAFGLLVSQYMRRAYFGALGLVGNQDDALDLSQEAFARAYSARKTIDPNRPFYTWYYQILRRLCFNFVRDRGARHARLQAQFPWLVAEAEYRGDPGPDAAASRGQARAAVRRAIEALPMREREVIILREFQELSYRDIANLLDIPVGTVMSRLYAARNKLAQQLDVFDDKHE